MKMISGRESAILDKASKPSRAVMTSQVTSVSTYRWLGRKLIIKTFSHTGTILMSINDQLHNTPDSYVSTSGAAEANGEFRYIVKKRHIRCAPEAAEYVRVLISKQPLAINLNTQRCQSWL